MRKFFVLGISLFFLTLAVLPAAVSAEEFAITKIGALSVNGKYYSHWWYEPTNLTMEGTGSRGANIDVYVDGNVSTIKASVDTGLWKYTHPTQLEKKDHTITVASGDKKISFTLTVGAGSVPADQQTQAKGILPETGSILPFIGILSLVGILIFYGFRERVA